MNTVSNFHFIHIIQCGCCCCSWWWWMNFLNQSWLLVIERQHTINRKHYTTHTSTNNVHSSSNHRTFGKCFVCVCMRLLCGVLIQTRKFHCNFQFIYAHVSASYIKLRIKSCDAKPIAVCNDVQICVLVSIEIGFRFRSGSPDETVTQMHFNHFNSLESLLIFFPSFFFNSQIKTWIFIFDAFHFFNRYPIKYSDFFPFYFCFFFETNIHLTFIFYSLKLSESEQWTRMNGKKSLIKILQCIGIDPQQSLKVWHITTKLPTAIRNIRSILPN